MIQSLLDRIAEAVIPESETQADAERKAVLKHTGRMTTYMDKIQSVARIQRQRRQRGLATGAVLLTLGSILAGVSFGLYGVTFTLPIFALIGIGLFLFFSTLNLARTNPLRRIKNYWDDEKNKLDGKLLMLRNGDQRHAWEKGLELISEDWDEISGKVIELVNENKKARKQYRRERKARRKNDW